MSAETAALAATPHPLGRPGGPGLFHDRSLSLPPYIQNIAHSLMTKRGLDKSRAIQMAIGVAQRWAAGGGKVHPEVRVAAQEAIAAWEAAKAKARATPNKDVKLSHHFNPDEPRDPDGKWSALDAMKALLASTEDEDTRPYPKVDHNASWSNVTLHGKTLSGEDTETTSGGNTSLAASTLDKAEHNAINDYVTYDSDTQRINRKLRNGEALDAEEEARNRGLDSVAGKAALSRDTDLWRGSSLTDEQLKALTPGSVVHDPGYASTSFSRDVAEYYMHERGHDSGKKVLFRIKGRKGAPVIPVRGDETVLPRGTRMHVTDVSHNGEFPVITVTHTHDKPVELSQPMALLRTLLDGPQAVELASHSLTNAAREKAAKEHQAMPDGSFPIRDRAELEKAIKAHGRAKDPEAVKKWIIKRAKQLKATDLLPDGWCPPGEHYEMKLSQPMQLLRGIADGTVAVELARAPLEGSTEPPKQQSKKPAPKDGQYQKGRHELPPGAVGWKHGWVPVDKNGNPVGPSQLNKSSQEIKDMAGHDKATQAAIASAYKNKAEADAKKAATKAKSAAKAASRKAAAAKKRAAAEAKRRAKAKQVAAKRAATAAKQKAAAEARAKAVKVKARQKLVAQATRQALADKKAGRPLTPSQQRLIDAYEAQQSTTLDKLRNDVNLAQAAVFGGGNGYSETAVPTGSSQDGMRGTVNMLKDSVPKRVLSDAVKKAQKKRRKVVRKDVKK